MKSFIVFVALVAVALARAPGRRQAPTTLYAEPYAAKQSAPPIALYAEPVAPPKEAAPSTPALYSAPSIPALYAVPVPAASQEAPRIASLAPAALVAETPLDNDGLGSYRFAFEQTDGQKREESAELEVASDPKESILRVQGSYSYVGDDGKTYTVTYIADENGFQPQGEHLPVAPVA